MRESVFGQRLAGLIEQVGVVLKVHGHAFQEAGWPDLQVYSVIWTGHLELKVDKGQLSPIQVKRIVDLRKTGTPAWCLRSVDEKIYLEDENGTRLHEWFEFPQNPRRFLEDLRDNGF